MTFLDKYGRRMDYIDVRQQTAEKIFLAKLREKAQVATKGYFPFCRRCAKVDFDLRLKGMRTEMEQSNDLVEKRELKKKIDEYVKKFDFAPYEDKKRFEFLKHNPGTQRMIHTAEGRTLSEQVVVTMYEEYACKRRKCKLSVGVPVSVWEKRHNEEAEEITDKPIRRGGVDAVLQNKKGNRK